MSFIYIKIHVQLGDIIKDCKCCSSTQYISTKAWNNEVVSWKIFLTWWPCIIYTATQNNFTFYISLEREFFYHFEHVRRFPSQHVGASFLKYFHFSKYKF